jgi:hypothetical protein
MPMTGEVAMTLLATAALAQLRGTARASMAAATRLPATQALFPDSYVRTGKMPGIVAAGMQGQPTVFVSAGRTRPGRTRPPPGRTRCGGPIR